MLHEKLRRISEDEARGYVALGLGLLRHDPARDTIQEVVRDSKYRPELLNQAAIAQEGTPRELYEAPADVFVADFIGDANLVEAAVARLEGEQAVVDIGGLEKRLPHRGLGIGPAKVAIRPFPDAPNAPDPDEDRCRKCPQCRT